MFSKILTRLAAVCLACVVQMPAVFAAPVVTGTTASGYVGDVVKPTMSVDFNGFDASAIAAWNFVLSWDATALTFDQAGSSMTIGGTPASLTGSFLPPTVTQTGGASGDDFYSLLWVDKGFSGVDLSGGIAFTAAFTINAAATPGNDYAISFGYNGFKSTLLDGNNFDEVFYDTVTTGTPMQVTVLRANPSQVPEPGTLALMAVALLGLHVAVIRRRATQI